jgi:hypothetical protein
MKFFKENKHKAFPGCGCIKAINICSSCHSAAVKHHIAKLQYIIDPLLESFMRSLSRMLTAVAITSAAFALPAKAAPLSGLANPAAGESNLIQKVHYWHYDCQWGPFRYHRHVPGVGNVRCYRDHYRYRRYRDYDDDYGYRYRRHYKKRYWKDDDYYGR